MKLVVNLQRTKEAYNWSKVNAATASQVSKEECARKKNKQMELAAWNYDHRFFLKIQTERVLMREPYWGYDEWAAQHHWASRKKDKLEREEHSLDVREYGGEIGWLASCTSLKSLSTKMAWTPLIESLIFFFDRTSRFKPFQWWNWWLRSPDKLS